MKCRITIEMWNCFYQRVESLGTLYEVPDVARTSIESQGLIIREQMLRADGQRIWRVTKK